MSRPDPFETSRAGFMVEANPSELVLGFWGPTLEACLTQAASGLEELLAGPSPVEPLRELSFTLQGQGRQDTLCKLLTELLFYFDMDALLFECIHLQRIQDWQWLVTVKGEPFDPTRHSGGRYVRGIDGPGCQLEAVKNGWQGSVRLEL